MEKTKIAIFVDVENLTKWVKEDGLESLVNDLGDLGRIVTRKAYGVWSNSHILNLQAPLNRLGFDLVHSFHPVSGKNSADIQLTMDVLESAIRISDINQIVLATGDSDFSPLFRRLREMGKEIIGVGPRSPLSECVKSSCTRYIYTDIVEEQDAQYELRETFAVVEELLEASSEPMPLSSIKNSLISRDNAFDERNWNYVNFSSFMRDIPNIEIFQAENKTHWMGQIKAKVDVLKYESENYPANVELYRTQLRKINWPFVSQSLIYKLHFELLKLPAMDIPDIKESLIQQVSPNPVDGSIGITATDIRKGVNVFLKAQLFDITNDNRRKFSGDPNYIEAINTAIVERVKSICTKLNIAYDDKALAPLLYSV